MYNDDDLAVLLADYFKSGAAKQDMEAVMNKQQITRRLEVIGAEWYQGNDKKELIPDGLGHRAYRIKYIGIKYCYSLKEVEAWIQKVEQSRS